MTTKISKTAEAQLLQQIAKECRAKAIKSSWGVAAVMVFFSFVVMGFPYNLFSFFVATAISAITTVIITAFIYALFYNKQVTKYGIQISIPSQACSNTRSYDDLFGSACMKLSVNPATGVPMAGSVDARGNAYGSKSS